MRILITGASGFIGSNLVPYLTNDIKDVVFVYLVRKSKGYKQEITWQQLDNSDLSDIDAVIHLAGLAHDTRNTLNEDAYFEVNYKLTKKLYNWYMKSNATKFIYVSSVKAAADSISTILTEEVKPEPKTAYGRSKLKAEDYIQQLSLGKTNKSYYILRPCMVHGPGNKGNLNLFYKFVDKGLPYPLGAFDNSRSFLSVENFCYITSNILSSNISSGVYNLADDEPLSTQELFYTIAAAIGKKAKVWSPSKATVSALAKVGDKFKLPVNTERLEKLTENYVVSNEKIKKELGIASLPVSTKEGITKTILSFNEHAAK